MPMNWTDRVDTEKPSLLSAMLPEWFIDSVDRHVPKQDILKKLARFTLEAGQATARADGTAIPAEPSPEEIEALYGFYLDILNRYRAA